jgi:hypothetical protein
MKHVEAAHAFVARHHIADGIIAHVAHVDASRGIWKHLEHVVLGLGSISAGAKRLLVGPNALPFFLDFFGLVAFFHGVLHHCDFADWAI